MLDTFACVIRTDRPCYDDAGWIETIRSVPWTPLLHSHLMMAGSSYCAVGKFGRRKSKAHTPNGRYY